MKLTNLVLLFVISIVAGFVGPEIINLCDRIPMLIVLEDFGQSADEAHMLASAALRGLDFWLPIVNFGVSLFSLVVPIVLPVVMLAFGEKKLFQRQATFHVAVNVMMVLAVAICLTFRDYSAYQQYVFTGVSYSLYAAYVLMYQILGTINSFHKKPQTA